jgi:hypothetical protein
VQIVGLLRWKFQVQKDSETLFGGGGKGKLKTSRVINVLKKGHDVITRRGKDTEIIQKTRQMLGSKGGQEIQYVWWSGRRRERNRVRRRRSGKRGEGRERFLKNHFHSVVSRVRFASGGAQLVFIVIPWIWHQIVPESQSHSR